MRINLRAEAWVNGEQLADEILECVGLYLSIGAPVSGTLDLFCPEPGRFDVYPVQDWKMEEYRAYSVRKGIKPANNMPVVIEAA